MRSTRRFPCLAFAALGLLASALVAPRTASAQTREAPNGASLVRWLGPHAADAFTVRGAASREMHAQVALPPGTRAGDLGLSPFAPGFARFTGTAAGLLALSTMRPDLRIEVAPPLHTLLNDAAAYVFADQAIAQGLDGTGALVGIADTGLDVTHPDFLDAAGHTRVAWLLDLSAPPRGVHADLEKEFGVLSSTGSVQAGAVWSAAEIDLAIAAGATTSLPHDEVGHGTLVTSCAAGNGLAGKSAYRGIAPGATILFARVTGSATDQVDTDDMLRGVAFLFDRATAMNQPVVVNLSLGSDFGPHDGTMAWEQMLASYVGPDHPGRALVAAAGNGGSIAPGDGPLVHQNVYVSQGSPMRVPISAAAAQNGGAQIWVAMHAGADLRVGLAGPDGTWIDPVAGGQSAGHASGGYDAAVYNGGATGSPVPSQSQGAVVAWEGAWPAGEYDVTLEGSGTVDLYIDASGDAHSPDGRVLGFVQGVREGTIDLPATNPSIIGVGCTINKRSWRALDQSFQVLAVPRLDLAGGVADGQTRDPIDGEPCWFSSAGPTLTGVQKPEIMAPGAAIVGALSQQAVPPAVDSIFENATCPTSAPSGAGNVSSAGSVANGTGGTGAASGDCEVIDALHGVSAGTSFSAPIVAGAIAVLLQHDPTLTEDTILAALQGGAHPLRGPAPFDDQAGAGEVDVLGAVAAVDRLRDPSLALPARVESWMTLGASEYLADGSTPLQAILELRAARGPAPGAVVSDDAGIANRGVALPADGFAEGRLAVYALVDGQPYGGAVPTVRRGAGIWVATVQLPPGLGSQSLTLGATFDGAPIVASKTVPIATDAWSAEYPATVGGGCAVGRGAGGRAAAFGIALALVAVARQRRSRTR